MATFFQKWLYYKVNKHPMAKNNLIHYAQNGNQWNLKILTWSYRQGQARLQPQTAKLAKVILYPWHHKQDKCKYIKLMDGWFVAKPSWLISRFWFLSNWHCSPVSDLDILLQVNVNFRVRLTIIMACGIFSRVNSSGSSVLKYNGSNPSLL